MVKNSLCREIDDGQWWPSGLQSMEDAHLISTLDGEGNRREVHLFIGGLRQARGGPGGKPQAFFVHMVPHDTVSAHFHRVDQFQVFFGVEGSLYQRTPILSGQVVVQYADAYSTYGPLASGSEGLGFFTLRAAGDGVTAYMPGSRDLLVHRGRRLLQRALWPAELLDLKHGETRIESIWMDERDKFGCFLLRGGPNAVATIPSVTQTRGQYTCVIGGEVRCEGRSFGAKALAWSSGQDNALQLDAGPDVGFAALVMRYPDPPSSPYPEDIGRVSIRD